MIGSDMEIELRKESRADIQEVLKAYLNKEFEVDIGDLRASIFLDHLLEHLGPMIYNKALYDMQTQVAVRLDDIVDSLFKNES